MGHYDVFDILRLQPVVEQTENQFPRVPLEIRIDDKNPGGSLNGVNTGTLGTNKVEVVKYLNWRLVPVFAGQWSTLGTLGHHIRQLLRRGTHLIEQRFENMKR